MHFLLPLWCTTILPVISVLLIVRVLAEGLCSAADHALVFVGGWSVLRLDVTHVMLQPGRDRNVWVGGRWWLFCSHSKHGSFRDLQAQTVICGLHKVLAHPAYIKRAIGRHAVLSWRGQSYASAVTDCSPFPSPLSSVPHHQAGDFVSPAEMFLAFGPRCPPLHKNGHFCRAQLPQDLLPRDPAQIATLRPGQVLLQRAGVLLTAGSLKVIYFSFFLSYWSSVKETFHEKKK